MSTINPTTKYKQMMNNDLIQLKAMVERIYAKGESLLADVYLTIDGKLIMTDDTLYYSRDSELLSRLDTIKIILEHI